MYTARRGGVRHGTRVRSAPDDDADRNRRQRERLQQLSDYCRRNARRLMFELLVPPTRALINSVRGDQPVYDRQLRPTLMLAAMRSLADYLAHKITRARPPRASHGVTELGPLSSSARVRGACPRCKAHLKYSNGAPHGRPDRARHALHQYAAQPLDRRRRTGAVGTSGHADGDRADRVLPVATTSALRSARPALDDPRRFRQEDSRCTGHPEFGWTTGVETTTGPLGQGVANSVGMAIAARWLAATFNRPGYELFDHRVYALCSDGDIMEGISSEAASLAGHLKLDCLCWIYDDNEISIEGDTRLTSSDDVAARFLAYHWNVERVDDANDLRAFEIDYGNSEYKSDVGMIFIVRSHSGYGAPHMQDSKDAHGEPLGAEEARAAKAFYGMDPDAQFHVPDGVVGHFRDGVGRRGAAARAEWHRLLAAYRAQYPTLAEQLDHMAHRDLTQGWDSALPAFATDAKGMATRDASGKVLNAIAANTRCAPSRTACVFPNCAPSLRVFSSLPTIAARPSA